MDRVRDSLRPQNQLEDRMKRAPFRVIVKNLKTKASQSGDAGTFKEARATAKHFQDHGFKDDQLYLRMRE